jgi:hypothetical protein
MTNRDQLIRDGVTDAYAEYAGVPWSDASKSVFPTWLGLSVGLYPAGGTR